MALYGWNARVSAALMLPAHFAEVSTRNGVSDVLAKVYGDRWPWASDFRQSLPNSSGYNPRNNLKKTADAEPTTGKVIAELKFVFWEKMFTARYDDRLWTPYISTAFPNGSPTPAVLREEIYSHLEAIRRVRNRIAHHEPLLTVDLSDLRTRMIKLVRLRSSPTATWVDDMDEAGALISAKP